MCTSVNNQPMSIIWNWACYGAFLFRHWHSQPFNGRLLGNSYLSVSLPFEFPTNPFHTDPLQNGWAGSQLLESGLCYREPDKPITHRLMEFTSSVTWRERSVAQTGKRGQWPRLTSLSSFAIFNVALAQDNAVYCSHSTTQQPEIR